MVADHHGGPHQAGVSGTPGIGWVVAKFERSDEMAQASRVSPLVGVLLFGASCLVPGSTRAADPNALWEIVHDKCVPREMRTGDPNPARPSMCGTASGRDTPS